MPRASVRGAFACAVLSVLVAPCAAAQEGAWALTNARIETVTRGVIEHGTIVIRDGLIAAVGADVTAPADARVVDLSGRTVYPGLIDLTSSLGLPQAPAAGGPGGGGGAAANPATPPARTFVGLEPERLVADDLHASQTDIKAARDAGFTSVLSAPVRGAFRGRSALIPLRDSVSEREVIRSPVALHLGYQGVGGGFGGRQFPGTLIGVIAYERQQFYDARRQAMLLDRYRTNPRGMERPPHDDALEALIPVVKGELPVFFAASNENEIRRAIRIAREFNLQMTVVGATEGFRAIDVLSANRRPVIVSVDYPKAPDVTGWAYRSAQRLPPNDSAAADSAGVRILQGNPAALMHAGVKFALASGGKPADFLSNVRKAIAAGLPRDSALADMTIRPAEIAGVAESQGSIEAGKAANLVVSEGDLLGDSAKVRMVFVDGIRYAVDPPPPVPPAGPDGGRRGRGGPGGGGSAAAPAADLPQIAGSWDITVTTPDATYPVSLVLTQTGPLVSGNMSSQMGSSAISAVSFDGRRLTFNAQITLNGNPTTLNYAGEITGSRFTGNVTAGENGTFPFTGEKKP